jgi:hypothetical protein
MICGDISVGREILPVGAEALAAWDGRSVQAVTLHFRYVPRQVRALGPRSEVEAGQRVGLPAPEAKALAATRIMRRDAPHFTERGARSPARGWEQCLEHLSAVAATIEEPSPHER